MALTEEDRKWIDTRFDQAFEAFSRHLLDEMGRRFAEVNATLASIDNRLKLQAGLIQSGARAMARFSKFAEDSETRWLDLENRVQTIERKLADRNAQ